MSKSPLLLSLFLLFSLFSFAQKLPFYQDKVVIDYKEDQGRFPFFATTNNTEVTVCGLDVEKEYHFISNFTKNIQGKVSLKSGGKLVYRNFINNIIIAPNKDCIELIISTNKKIRNEYSILSISEYIEDENIEETQKNPSPDSTASKGSLANITVNNALTPEQLIKDIFIGGDCFDVTAINPFGFSSQRGEFFTGTTSISIEEGILLSTGLNLQIAPGPNDQSNAGNGFAGNPQTPDPDLNLLTTRPIFNRSGYEFDFVPTQSSVSFEYVFASEEYCEFAGSMFNDVFGFFISGPGINGTFSNNAVNIAQVPGTNLEVSVGNINFQTNSAYYVDNVPVGQPQVQIGGNGFCGGAVTNPPFAPNDCQFDGFTVPLTASISGLIPCQTYQIRLVIADVGDPQWDSGVFLRANSFSAGGLASAAPESTEGANEDVFENCENACFIFTRESGDDANDLIVNFTIDPTSTATEGIDFGSLPTSITIPAGSSTAKLPITIFADLITEGSETLILNIDNACSCTLIGSTLTINDGSPINVDIDPIADLCSTGTIVTATATPSNPPGIWGGDVTDPSTGEIDPSDPNLNIGTNTITYTYTDPVSGCMTTATEDYEIIQGPEVELDPAGPFCEGDPGEQLVFSPTSGSGGSWSGTGVSSTGFFTPSAPGSFPITYTYTDGPCSADTTIIIDVNPLPVVSITPDPIGPFCEDAPILTLTGTPADGNGGTGVWSGTGIVPNSNGVIDPSTLPPNNSYSATYTFTTDDNCTDFATVNFTIEQTPEVNLTPEGPFCEDDGLQTLNASHTIGTASWTGAPGGAFNPAGNVGLNNVTYTATSGNCMADTTITIEVFPLPIVSITPDPVGPFCEDAPSITLTGSPADGNGGTGVWSGTGIVPNSNGVIDPSTLLPNNSYSATYTFTTDDNCTDFATVNFTIEQTPEVNLTPEGPFCEDDDPQTLNASHTIGTASWTGAPGGVFNPAGNVGLNNVTYTVTNGGCIADTTIIIEVFPTPIVSITPDPVGPFCADALSITLTGSPTDGVGGTGIWSGTGVVPNSNGVINPSTLPPNNTYSATYTFTTDNNCTDFTTVNFVINPLPTVSITPIAPVCENAGITTLSAIPAFPAGNWFGDVDANGSFDPSPSTGLGAGNYTATYEYTDANGCFNFFDLDFEVVPAPVVSIAPVDPICATSAIVQLVGIPNGAGGVWSGPGVTPNGQFDPSIGEGNYNITYTFTNADNNCTDFATIVIQVGAEPTLTYLSDDEFCIGAGIVLLDADPINGDWGGAANVFGELDVDGLGPGQYTVTYTYEEFAGCSSTITVPITINSGTPVTFTNIGPFCENDPMANLMAVPGGGIWGGASLGGAFTPSTTGPGIHDVTYIFTNAEGCVTDTIAEVEVFAAPDVDIDAIDDLCPEGAVTQLTASPSNGIWGGAANANGEIDPTSLPPGISQVTYEFTNADGCTDTETEDFEVLEEPNFIYLNNGPFCLENEIQTLDVDPFGGEWGGDVNFLGEFNPIDLGVGIFTATYFYEYGPDCEANSSTDFEIFAAGTVVFGDSVFCQNTGTVTLTANPTGGTWNGTIVSNNGQINTDGLALGNYTVTYTVNPTGTCELTKDLMITIEGIEATIDGPDTYCQTEAIQTYTGMPTGGTWGGVANASGEVDPTALTIGTHDITYTVTSPNGCMDTETQTITITPPPTAIISGNETICPTGNTTADLMINLTGNAPWQVEYTIDGVPQVTLTINSSPFALSATEAGTYELTSVIDDSNCSNTASGTATITELDPLAISNLTSQCDGTNTGYTISFEITGGDAATYTVSGITGTISPAAPFIFTSQTIPSGSSVSFVISDNSSCAPVNELVTTDCSCETVVGEMDITPIDICGTGTATATYDASNEVLDADDLIQFVLHTNSGVSLGNILATNSTPSFDFAAPLMFGTTYYISAIAGSNDGTGNVDLADGCLQVAAGTPITWREEPTAILSGGTSICAGEEATLLITLTGEGPWTIQYSDGSNTFDLNGITTSPFELLVSPTATTTYTLTTVATNFCPGTVSGTETVTVNDSPMMSTPTTQCDATFSNYVVTFNITGGDLATYMVTGITGTIANGVFTSDPIPSGTTYQINLSDANGCPPVTFSDNVDCGCLTTVGEMDNSPLRICGDGPAIANYNDLLEMLDADDVVRFVLHTSPTNTIGNILAWNDVPEFSFDAATMTYGTTYYISAVAGNDAGGGTIDLSDNCTDISFGTPVEFREEPTASISGDASICAGETVQLTFNLTGSAPWAIVYNDGTTDRNLTVTDATSTVDVNPIATTTYTLVSVRDGNCPGTISGTATVTIVEAPDVENVEAICNLNKTEYTVTFNIIGGDAASYTVTGNNGTLTGGVFTSDPIATGTGYSFTITDMNNCNPITIDANNVLCDCETEAGTLENMPQEVCVGETVTLTHNGDDFLDANDVLMFALHDGSPSRLGNILVLSPDPTFVFDASIMMTGVTYFISAVAGNGDPSGIDLGDPCLSVSIGVPVLFNALPTVLLTAPNTICNGDEVSITLELSGAQPFTVVFADGTTLDNINTGNELMVSPTASTTYEVVSIVDANGCENTTPSEVIIEVNEPVTATVIPATICNTNDNNNITALDFSTLITAGDATGTWRAIDVTTATGTLPNLDFTNVAPGQYRFEYTTAAAQAPCTNESYIITIDVTDCACPSVATAPTGPFCIDNASLDLADITTTAEAGIWTITDEPAGSNLMITNNIFNPTVVGDYELTFTLDSPISGCPSSSSQMITIVAPPSATVTPTAQVCNSAQSGAPTTFDFSTLITAGDATGSWVDLDGSGATGTLPNLDFTGVAPGQYRFEYTTATAQAPCTNTTFIATIDVSDCSCPSVATAPAGPFCNDDAVLNLADITITTEAGSWDITSQPVGSAIEILNNVFDATGAMAGDYELTFTLTSPTAGCPSFSTQTISISEAVSAGNGPGTMRICNDDAIINLFDELIGATPGGTWTDASINSANGFNDGVLNTQNLPAGTYVFNYQVAATAPCMDDAEQITIEIENPVNAGNLIENVSLCEGIDTTINLFDLIENNDAGGIWRDISVDPINGFTNNSIATANLPTGVYQFEYALTTTGICPDDRVVVMVEMSPSPTAEAGNGDELTCDNRLANIGGQSSQGPNITYQWTGSTTIEDPQAANTTVRSAGVYTLRVTDTASGCFTEDVVEITEESSLPTLRAGSIEITCFGDNDGVIEVEEITGGNPPYLFSLNGGPFSTENTFDNLTPGDYTLTVEDSDGCGDMISFTIEEPEELTVTLTTSLGAGSNLIQRGDSIQLNGNITGVFDSIVWTPAEAFDDCDPEIDPNGCLTPWVAPTEVTTFELFAVNENGCSDRSSVTVFVEKNQNVYIPSAFSPDNDGINDVFRIFTDENIEEIKSFLVFDRWGNNVYEYTNFQPDDPAGSWDGSFRGQPMNSAVFVYFAIVEFKDGTEQLYEGDVTLLR